MPAPSTPHHAPFSRLRIRVFIALFASLSLANFVADTAESTPKDHEPVAGTVFKRCHDGKSLTQDHLQGDWQVLWQDQPQDKSRPEPLKFSPNAEHLDSLMGELNQEGRKILLAGDFEDGQLVLEESPDGKRISATWTAQVKAGSCGTAFVGTRVVDVGAELATDLAADKTSAARKPRAFMMRRVGGG
jgi:hypothetical protein